MKFADLDKILFLRTVGALALVGAASAQGPLTGSWTGVQVLEPTMVSASPPQAPIVACDPAGHAVSVWNSPALGVAFTERYPGGNWTSASSIVPGVIGDFPQIAIGASGVVAASWVIPGGQYVPPKFVVSVRLPGGVFSSPKLISSGVYIFDSRLGVSAKGEVTIVWTEGGKVMSETRSRGGVWSSIAVLSSANAVAGLPDFAMNSAGAAIAVWQETPVGGGGPSAIVAACRAAPASSSWGAPQLVSAGSAAPTWNPKPGIDTAGDVAVGYLEGNTMMLATKAAASAWTMPLAVSPPRDAVYYPALAMDSAGNILTAWQKLDAGNYGTVSKRMIPASGPWGPVTVLSTVFEDASWPTASIASNGSVAIVTWVDNSTFAARAALGRVRGPWTVFDIGLGWWNTQVPVAAGATAVSAVWSEPTGNPNVTNMVANVFTP